jgi:hypothetical protein
MKVIEEELFLQALELPQEERNAFLRKACGDDALRSNVETLLSAHESDSQVLQSLVKYPEDIYAILSEEIEARTADGSGACKAGGGPRR